MSTYTVVGSGPEVPCSQSERRHTGGLIHSWIMTSQRLKMAAAAASYLQADGQVDPAAERRADGARVEAQVFEKLGEGVRQRHPGPLLRHHHAGPDPGQVQTPSLQQIQNTSSPRRPAGGAAGGVWAQILF